jgi:hypothetical protein
MQKFLKYIFLFSIPIVAIIVAYIIIDPFKVLYHYDSYYLSNQSNPEGLNGDYVALETYKNHNPNQHFDAFIMGSSRSLFYQVDSVKKYTNAHDVFHFQVSSESIYGLNHKVNYIDKNGGDLKHCLIILDHLILSTTTNGNTATSYKHPDMTGESMLNFKFSSFLQMFNGKFLFAYIYYKLTGHILPYAIEENLLDDKVFKYDGIRNEKLYLNNEKLAATDPQKYYALKKEVFYKRSGKPAEYEPVIKEAQIKLLKEMAEVFKKHHTNLKIVISPLYDQLAFNKADLKVLQSLFGEESIYDFSGINSITNNVYNYFETSHYRPHISNLIIRTVFANDAQNQIQALYIHPDSLISPPL